MPGLENSIPGASPVQRCLQNADESMESTMFGGEKPALLMGEPP